MECPDLSFVELKTRAMNAYARWGVSEKFFENNKITSPENFLELLKIIEGQIPGMNCRVMPSSFDPDDQNLLAYPYYLSPRWDSCEKALRAFGARGVMMRLPLFWQTESLLHHACRAVSAFIFINESTNMPVGALALREGEVNTIVTDINDALVFSSYLRDKKFPLNQAWIIVHQLTNDIVAIPEVLMKKEVYVAQEVHIFPGVPLLEQCSKLWEKKSPLFHLSDSYRGEETETGFVVTSTEDVPFPFFRYELPRSIHEKEKCECGKTIFATEI